MTEQYKAAFVARDFATLQNQIARIPEGVYLARRFASEHEGNLTIFLQNEKTGESFYVQCPPIAQAGAKRR